MAHECTASTSGSSAVATSSGEGDRDYGCVAEEVADARLLSRTEVLAAIESLTYQFLQAISKGEDPELLLVRLLAAPLSFIPPPPPSIYLQTELTDNILLPQSTNACFDSNHRVPSYAQTCRSEKNVVRDASGHLHLGKTKTVKRLFTKNGTGAERYAKSEYVPRI